MRYTPFRLVSIAILIFASTVDIYALESGWEQMTVNKYSYKFQKLVINDLVSVQVSPDNKSIYTYHNDAILRIWDFQRGVLLDSVKFTPQPDEFQFSKDGKTAVIVDYGIHPYNPDLPNISIQKIKIYDLASKKTLCNTTVDFNKYFTIYDYEDYKSLYDYSSDKNEMYMRTSATRHSSDYMRNQVLLTYGHFIIFEVKKDSFIIKKEISKGAEVIDFLYYNDSTLLYTFSSSYHSFYNLPDAGLPKDVERSFSNGLTKSNLFSNTNSSLISYSNRYTPEAGYTGSSGYVGNIFPTSMQNRILFEGTKSFYYYDLSSDSILRKDSIRFPFSGRLLLATTYSANDVLVMYQYGNFYFNDIRTTAQLDSIATPVSITSFTVTNNDKSLLAWNSQGIIILIDIERITPVKEETIQTRENVIFPNPTTGIITLNNSAFQSGQLKINLVNLTGNTHRVLYDNFYNQEKLSFDISNVPAGSYLVTAHQNSKATSFKVVKE